MTYRDPDYIEREQAARRATLSAEAVFTRACKRWQVDRCVALTAPLTMIALAEAEAAA